MVREEDRESGREKRDSLGKERGETQIEREREGGGGERE